MNNYAFDFNPVDCKTVYFEELFALLRAIDPEQEKFARIKQASIKKLKIKCENTFNSCKPDEFFF